MNQETTSGEAGRGLGAAPGSATGWWNPTPYSNRRRVVFHYVTETGRTLCGKWAYVGLGTVEEGQDDHGDNCAECRKKKLALNAKSPNEKVSDGGPLTHKFKQDANPPFAAPLG